MVSSRSLTERSFEPSLFHTEIRCVLKRTEVDTPRTWSCSVLYQFHRFTEGEIPLPDLRTFFQSSLELIRDTENGDLVKESLRFSLRHSESPTSTLEILGVLPDWFHTLAEDVHCVSLRDLVPWVVVVDAVKGSYVRNVFV